MMNFFIFVYSNYFTHFVGKDETNNHKFTFAWIVDTTRACHQGIPGRVASGHFLENLFFTTEKVLEY